MRILDNPLLLLLVPVALVGGTWLFIMDSDGTDTARPKVSTARDGHGARPAPHRAANSGHVWRGFSSAARPRQEPRWAPPLADDMEPDPLADDMGEVPPDPEVELEQLMASWQSRLDEHQAEAVDRGWKSATEPRFHEDLQGLAQSGERQLFDVSAVDCRSETCVATIDFGSFEDARISVGSLLQHTYEVNCATTTIMPQPEDTTQPYSAKLLFECDSEHAS